MMDCILQAQLALLVLLCVTPTFISARGMTLPAPNRYMPRSFLQVDTTHADQWRPALDDAANAAVRVINSFRPLDKHLALDRVDVEGVRVGRALAFSGTLELSHTDDRLPSSYAFTQHSDFVHLHPVQALSHLWTLPSAASASSAGGALVPLPDDVPAFPDVELEGPLVLYLDQLLYDPELRLPHRIEAGAVRVIKVGAGVRLRLGGISQMRLRSAIDVQRNLKLLALMDESNATTVAAAKRSDSGQMDVPELELKLVDRGSAFRVVSSSTAGERVKVKRRSANVLELLSSVTASSVADPAQASTASTDLTHAHAPAHAGPSSSEQWVLSQANLLRAVAEAFTQAAEGQPTVLRRLIDAKADPVSVLVIPMTLRAEQTAKKNAHHGGSSSETSHWQVVVTRDAAGRHSVVSHQQLLDVDETTSGNISIAPSLLANTTWPAVMHSVQLLQQRHQPPQASR